MTIAAPISLPEFHELVVVALHGSTGAEARSYLDGSQPTERATPESALAVQIVELIRRLPDAEPMRCHTPPFGLLFLRDGRTIGHLTICWKCNTIQGEAEGNRLSRSFDAASRAARELLELCKRAIEG